MSTKIDVLQKYISGGADKSHSKKKRKLPKHGFQLLDEDPGWKSIAPTTEAVLMSWENDEEEDKPVIVTFSNTEQQHKVKIGTWVDEERVIQSSASKEKSAINIVKSNMSIKR